MVMNHLCLETPEADVGIVNVGLNLCRCFFTSQKKKKKAKVEKAVLLQIMSHASLPWHHNI